MDEAEFPEDDDDDTDCGEGPDNADDLFERTAETLSDCFVKFCWANRRFDPTAFGEFTVCPKTMDTSSNHGLRHNENKTRNVRKNLYYCRRELNKMTF